MGIVKIFLYFIGIVLSGALLVFLQEFNAIAFYVGCFVVGGILAFYIGSGSSKRKIKRAGKKIPEEVLEKIAKEEKKNKEKIIEKVKEKPKKVVKKKGKKGKRK